MVYEYLLSNAQLETVKSRLQNTMKKGLAGEPACVKMLPTFVTSLPTRKQNGSYTGIDLGGSYLRILNIVFKDGKMDKKLFYFEIPKDVLIGNSDDLFDFVAKRLISASKPNEDGIYYFKTIGFSFSFPVEMKTLTSGTIKTWSKDFNVTGVVGNDVCELLVKSLNKIGKVKVNNVALLNDTVGTLLCGAQSEDNIKIGFIQGTGCNSCYIEKIENIHTIDKSKFNATHMIINTECAAFGQDGELDDLLNDYEKLVDSRSIRPGTQIFEKTQSGLYLSEIFSEYIKDEISKKNIRDIDVSSLLCRTLSKIIHGLKTFEHYLKKGISNEEEVFLTECCSNVFKRAGQLAGAGLAAMIENMGHKIVKIAADGSIVQNNKLVREEIIKTINILCPGVQVELKLIKDGSGTGATILASTLD